MWSVIAVTMMVMNGVYFVKEDDCFCNGDG